MILMHSDLSMIPITSQSINSPAIVKHKIEEECRIHWFLGLRQAELFIQDRLGALEHTKSQLSLLALTRRRKEIEVEQLRLIAQRLDRSPREKELTSISIAEIEIELTTHDRQFKTIEYQIRDAVAELDAATEMRSVTVKDHQSEIDNMTFDELQDAFGVECIEAKQVHLLATQMNALTVGDSIANTLSSIAPDRAEAVFMKLAQHHLSSFPKFSALIESSLKLPTSEDSV